MPDQPPRFCATPGCPTLTLTPRCPIHTRQIAATWRNADHAKVYRSRRWQILRRRVIADHPVCQQSDCTALATDVDHIVALADGGAAFARSNVQALCKPHHSAKTRSELRQRTH